MKKLKVMLSLTTALLVASSLFVLASCKNKQEEGGSAKNFQIDYIKVWEIPVTNGNVEVAGGSPKTVEVKAKNCKKFTLTVGDKAGTTTNGIAIVKGVDIPKGNSTLTLTLKANGFVDEAISVGVERKDTDKAFKVAVVAKTGDEPGEVNNGETVEVATDKAMVVVTAKAVMTEVRIGTETATLSSDGMKATAEVGQGNVEVAVTFADYNSKPFSFVIKKVAESELPIRCTSVKLITEKHSSGVPGANKFDSNKVLKWEAGAEDIQFSYVTVEMEFDVNINDKPSITCKDERSQSYSTSPTEKDFKGIFSGYVVKEADAKGNVSDVTPVEGKSYKQMFIAGAGKVEYELEFAATGRKETTYKIVIENKNDKVFGLTVKDNQIDLPVVIAYDALGANGELVNWDATKAMHLPSYHKGPAYKDLYKMEGFADTASFSDLSAIGGILKFYVETRFAPGKDKYDKEGGAYFYGATASEKGKCCEFTRYASETITLQDQNMCDALTLDIEVGEKFFDGFVAFRTKLPKPIHPVYTEKKWTIKGKIPLMVSVGKVDLKGSFENNPGCRGACGYRPIMNYLGKVQTTTSEKFKLYKKMSWKNWLDGKDITTETAEKEGGGKVLMDTGADSLFVTVVGKLKSKIKEATFTIKKGSEENNCTEAGDCNGDGQKVALITLRDGRVMLIPGVLPTQEGQLPFTLSKAYKFEKDKVYEVTLKVNLEDNTECNCIYLLNYKDNSGTYNVDFDDLDGDSSSDLFGVPMSSPLLRMPELECAALSRENAFVIK